MARLQELQNTVTGGNKVMSVVNLSPRSTRGYLKTSLRCKQESLRYNSSSPFSISLRRLIDMIYTALAGFRWKGYELREVDLD